MENEIRHSVAFISKKIGKKPGFSAPSNYFDNLEDDISIKISEENFAKNTSFKVPNTYFNNLEDTILEKISSKEKETKIISLKERVFKLIPYAAAASIALFIGLNSFVFNTDNANTLEALTDDDFEQWLDVSSIETDDIVEILPEDILEINEFSFALIEDESIEDYINSIDNTSLLNELN
ncbi:hypothetical protein BW723_11770 [Polaribacter reichenbachii]|uniref:Uncharacterized protein n=1 Tax=Polaribacter reichenbachii TaxID=996801 RepID=A0A1B8TPM0_9FLAO|nr:hypothetical protein [Polaribacter reichenbachii]APZ46919.1 hypothetical protein BW723_11770 [Polaribacter reichenbachii]AUC17562.1 hypothetical protein BTO17_02215 [Polaribacter reichenbachii]OBY61565.1 hypothetical protein LPB301_16005 [Polaribacter reichenbachii]